jgi:beta-phosphoglucomutase
VIKAIVFDFDGVIVDSEPLHHRAFAHVVADLGITFDYGEYLTRYAGYDDRDGFRTILADHADTLKNKTIDDTLIAHLCREKALAFERFAGEGVDTIPGVLALIHEAASQMPLAIASGATTQDIQLILGGLGLGDFFDPIISADDVQYSKPDPRTYALAVEGLSRRWPDLQIAADNCLALEDTPAGIESALGAGLKTLGLATTYRDQDLYTAHRVVDSLQGLTLQQLRGWF